MTVTVHITDENGCVVLHKEHADESKFYLGMIDVDGRYSSIGGAKPGKKQIIEATRESAHEWAKAQDLNRFFQELREMLIKESIKAGNIQAQLCLQADTFHFDADVLLSILKEVRQDVTNSFKESFGQEGGVILFHLTWEMLLTMIARLKEEISRVQTIWEYPSLPIGKDEVKAVLEWLFRRTEI